MLDKWTTSHALVEQEIDDQPAAWSRAAALDSTAGFLREGGRIALIGCGSSWSAAQAIAALREGRGNGETDAFPASEAPLARAYDRVVAISRSGTTSELLHALERLPSSVPTVALVGVEDSPIARACDEVVPLEFADDQSVVQTRFVTTTIALARACLGDDLGPVIDDGRTALERPLPAAADGRTHHVLLGLGWCAALASAGALTFRETARLASEAYPAMEYRHGPIAMAGANTAVWFLGPTPSGLAEQVAETGAAVIQTRLDPLAQLVQVQRVAVALARARGMDPDRPPNLSRSIVLEAPHRDGA